MNRTVSSSFLRVSACGLAALAAACSDGGPPLDPVPAQPESLPVALIELTCTAELGGARLTCGSPAPDLTSGPASDLIVGNQDVYIHMEGTNVAYDVGTEVWSADVSVQNLIPQALGTADGATLAPTGVRVFFSTMPTATSGTGSISIRNATGTGTFTASGQPFFQYDEILAPMATATPLTWEMNVPASVVTFIFKVLIAAPVQYPNGWIDIGADTIVSEGTSQPLGAVVRSVVGNVVEGAEITWSSSATAVAAADGDTLRALLPGRATLTATSGERSGTLVLDVCFDRPVGSVYSATMPAASGLCFAGGAAGAEYTYSPVNVASAGSIALTTTALNTTGVVGPPSPALLPGGSLLSQAIDETRTIRDMERHLSVLRRDREIGEALIGQPSARIVPGAMPAGPSYVIVPGTPSLGDLWSLNVASGCAGTRDDRIGRVVSIGNHVIIVADTANPAGGFTTAQYDSIAMEFDTIAYPVAVDNFGAPTDLDANSRVVAFYTRAVNELAPPASSVVIHGYVTSRDLYSASASGCTLSNEGEIFYMLVPDPTGQVNSNVRTVSSVRGATVGTLGHEFQHLINNARRIYVNGASEFESVWLNEGLSHMMEELMFYRASFGLTPGTNIDLADLTSGSFASRRVAAFNTYANQNYGRLRTWLQRPDTSAAFRGTDDLAARGAIWAFLRYAADRKAGPEAQLWFDLVNSTTSGTTNLQSVLGVDPDTWAADWVTSMYADDAVAGAGAEYQTTSWNFRSVYGGLGGFPLRVDVLSAGIPKSYTLAPGGATVYQRLGVPASTFGSVTTESGGAPPPATTVLRVMRTK